MNAMMALGAVLGFGSLVAFVLLFRAIMRRDRFDGLTAEWVNDYSAARYRPMQRLLAEEDFEFLAAQEGFEPRIARKLRRARRKIFREYLRCLRRDFGRLETAARLLMVNAVEDRPELAKALLRQRLSFSWGILAAECQLAMHAFGAPAVDVRGLVGCVDRMSAQVGRLALARAATSI